MLSAHDSRRQEHTADALHHRLAMFNRMRLTPRLPPGAELQNLVVEVEKEARLLENDFVERERACVQALAAEAPREPRELVAWFEQLAQTGPGQGDPLFPWLAEQAPLDAMTWFLRQEAAGEAGFDDLVALTQVKLPTRAKLELARNYWDEMGRGHELGMHGPLLGRLCDALGIRTMLGPDIVWEALALGNLMVALAANRYYAFHALGALGAIELTAPGRAACVDRGLKRLGVAGEARRYFALHATLDVRHSQAWNREVIAPLVAEEPARATAIAQGALLRLRAGQRCFARYRCELGLTRSTSQDTEAAQSVLPGA